MSSPVLNAKLVTTALTLSYEAATETFKNTPMPPGFLFPAVIAWQWSD
jgi:hypothetical protein